MNLSGKRVLITAGPTQEAIDPVRYISNHSSGKMGYAIAAESAKQGADVTVISGPVAISAPSQVTIIPVVSAQEMYEAAQERFPQADIIILAAAVADYTPAFPAEQKMKKSTESFTLELKKTVDIASTLGTQKSPQQTMVGFALETNDAEANARKKLDAKNLDFIVLNTVSSEHSPFGSETNKIIILDRNNRVEFELKSKEEVAKDIVAHLFQEYVA